MRHANRLPSDLCTGLCAFLLAGLASCAGSPAAPVGPPLEVPSYAASDPRPSTGGFVSEVRLAEVEQGGTRFVLMAFEVGGRLTLGAMTEGEFAGKVSWRLGNHDLEFEVGDARASTRIAVECKTVPSGAPFPTGVRGGFRDYRWVNIELETARWFPDRSGALGLSFAPAAGDPVTLPADGVYAASLVAR
ncbi:MAG: hypothetical protein KDE27_23230 [Planctomycetes bacterium]|nr:hypothetical protein [Planctomycetota bacterium]